MHVFTYGSLMFDPVWARVVAARGHRSLPASLAGYRRQAVIGETYPGVIAAPGGRVDGRLYLDVDAADLVRLDDFEGGDYERITVEVSAADGSRPQAGLYLYRLPQRLADADWDPDWFAREGIHRFLATYCSDRLNPPRGSA